MPMAVWWAATLWAASSWRPCCLGCLNCVSVSTIVCFFLSLDVRTFAFYVRFIAGNWIGSVFIWSTPVVCFVFRWQGENGDDGGCEVPSVRPSLTLWQRSYHLLHSSWWRVWTDVLSHQYSCKVHHITFYLWKMQLLLCVYINK